jgi:hypothetical protein
METAGWSRFIYREFYDYPRMVLVPLEGRSILLESRFDPDIDDYWDYYEVLELPPTAEQELAGSWVNLPDRKRASLGKIPVLRVHFDETRRRFLDLNDLVEKLIRRPP